MRILFLGAGGTGGYFGGRAAQAGADVTFLLREARAAKLREQGLQIRSPHGDAVVRPKWVTAQTLDGYYDVVVLSCKAYDLDNAMEAIRPAVGPDSVMLPILNGMRQYEVLEQAFGAQRVLGGLCLINAALGPEGEVLHLGSVASLVFGERSGEPRSARCLALEAALAPAQFSSRLSTDIHQECWEKYVFLATLAAATCLMRGTVGQIVSTDGGEMFLRTLLREAQAVAQASGFAVRTEANEAVLKVLMDRQQPMTASMYRDLSQGLAVEADHIIGDMLQRARVLGVQTPYMQIAYSHLQVYQQRRAARLQVE